MPTPDGLALPFPDLAPEASETVTTAWGPAKAVAVPGRIDGLDLAPMRPAGPLGRDAASSFACRALTGCRPVEPARHPVTTRTTPRRRFVRVAP